MSLTNKEILDRINAYAEEVMGDIDPQKVQVSAQLEKLRPIFTELASELNISLEDMFIKYMDLQTAASVAEENQLKDLLDQA